MSSPFHGRTITGLALDSGGRLAGCGAGFGWIVDLHGGKRVTALRGMAGHAHDMAFSPDGSRVATCCHGGDIHIHGDDGALQRVLVHGGVPDGVHRVAFDATGTRLASVGDEPSLRIWDPVGGEELDRFRHRASIHAVAWGPGPTEITLGTGSDIRIVDVETRNARVRDTPPVSAVLVAGDRVYAAWDGAVHELDAGLEFGARFAQANVCRLCRFGDALLAASSSGPDAGVSSWHLSSGARTRLESTECRPGTAFRALAIDPARGLLFGGATPADGRAPEPWPYLKQTPASESGVGRAVFVWQLERGRGHG